MWGYILNNRKTTMRRYLLVALWPACEAAIAAATVSAVRRASRDSGREASRARSAGLKQVAKLGGTLPGLVSGAFGRGTVPILSASVVNSSERGASPGLPGTAALPDWAPGLVTLGVVTGAGGVMAYKVMEMLGPTVVERGPSIDEPIRRWTVNHQVKRWADVMERLTKIGNTWTTWGAAGTAAATLAVAWPRRKWVPPAALGAAVLVDKYVTLALRHKFGRPGPPGSPGGTYPSGGVDRVVFFYGLIAYLLWREFSGSPEGKAWAVGAVAALSFNEAYSREYLSKHWFTDILSGELYGAILLAPFIAAVRLVAGPSAAAPVAPRGRRGPSLRHRGFPATLTRPLLPGSAPIGGPRPVSGCHLNDPLRSVCLTRLLVRKLIMPARTTG
jgi:PAP2 superfamily